MKHGKGEWFWPGPSVLPACPTYTADLGFSGEQKGAPFASFSDLSKVMVCGACRGPNGLKTWGCFYRRHAAKSLKDCGLFLVNQESTPPAERPKAFPCPPSSTMWMGHPLGARWPRSSCLPVFALKLVLCTSLMSCQLWPRRRAWLCLANASSC